MPSPCKLVRAVSSTGSGGHSDRLLDLQAVLAARDNGAFELPGERLVLAGHSLGALTALLAAGARPQKGWRGGADKIWMTFLSATCLDCCNVRSRTLSFRLSTPLIS